MDGHAKEVDSLSVYQADAFVAALQKGDAYAAATILQQMDELPASVIKQLADMLNPDVSPDLAFPWKLAFAGKKGRPKANRMDKRAFEFRMAMLVKAHVEAAPGIKLTAIYKQVQESLAKMKIEVGETRIREAYYRHFK